MKILKDEEEKQAIELFDKCLEIAKQSTCQRSKCGAIILKNNQIIGKGFNSPPNNLEFQRRCLNDKEDYSDKITDKTCCIHAEQRAICNALKNNPEKLKDSSLYFIRLDKNNNKLFAGKPYCTICSKMALDIGIKEFILWHEKGICVYNTEEYNNISYEC